MSFTGEEPNLYLTAVVTAHSEGRLLRPTLRSIQAAIEGLREPAEAELLIVLDNANEATVSEGKLWATIADLPFAVRTLEVSEGESGAARNRGVQAASGKFVALVDGDDLVSRNYFSSALDVLEASEVPAVVHPSLIISFGARSVYWEATPSTSPEISYLDLIEHNLWPSSFVASREIALSNPYERLHPEEGYGPEDWYWNIQTTILGIAHLTAPESVFMYRVRERGGVNNRHIRSILPAFDLDGLRSAMPVTQPSNTDRQELAPATQRWTTKRIVRGAYHRSLPVFRKLSWWASPDLKQVVRHTAGRTYQVVFRVPVHAEDVTKRRSENPALADAFAQLTEIEPAISWTACSIDTAPEWIPRASGYAAHLEHALEGLRGYSAIVAVPWVGVGGADLVSLNYAKALVETTRFAGKTAFLATHLPEQTRHDLIPGSVRYVQLDPGWRQQHPDQQKRLLAQLMILHRPELVISVNCFDVARSLSVFDRQMTQGTAIHQTLFAWDQIGAGYPTNPITDDAQREYLDTIHSIITDNSVTASLVSDRLALTPPKVRVHYQPALAVTPELPRATRAYHNEFFSAKNPFRLVWPHRLDKEKRPDVLPAIMRELHKRELSVAMDVWGQRVLTVDGDSLMEDLEAAGIHYRGSYQGGLPGINTYEYHALLLTSESEGLPLVLVQAMFTGVPIVASGVGGVVDLVRDGETGLTAAGPEDITGFADAVERLYRSVNLRRQLIEAGYALATSRHSWSAFTQLVQDDLVNELDDAVR